MDRKLIFLSPRDMRKNRADPVHIMHTCQAFSQNGWDVSLVTPRVERKNWPVTKEDIWGQYAMSPCFEILELPTRLSEPAESAWGERISRFVQNFRYFFKIRRMLSKNDVIYSKCYIAVLVPIILRKFGVIKSAIFIEKPDFAEGSRYQRFLCRQVDGVVAINNYIRNGLMDAYALSPERVTRLPFTSQSSKVRQVDRNAAREKLGLSDEQRLIVYAGKITFHSLEVGYILKAMQALCPAPEGLRLKLVGGVEKVVTHWAAEAELLELQHTEFVGFKSLEEFYEYVVAADLLLSYYDSEDTLSVNQRVPAKLGVYLASGNPVILADLPSMREWWSDEEVYFVEPDQPAKLADQIRLVFAEEQEAKAKGKRCLAFSESNTYESAYRFVSEFMDGVQHASRG